MEHLTNTEILCFVLGWQGGTVHQVCDALNKARTTTTALFMKPEDITKADAVMMRKYCRLAQRYRSVHESAT